jgi:L-alanine-DL-glutamate epimerase-like enolase superfamily enzyme
VRSYYLGWYREVVEDPLPVEDGWLTLPEKPGLGTRLREELLSRADLHMETSDLAHHYDTSKA